MTDSSTPTFVLARHCPESHEDLPGVPEWFHPCGSLMKLTDIDRLSWWIRFEAPNAVLVIQLEPSLQGFYLAWVLGSDEKIDAVKGRVLLTLSEMQSAFGFTDVCDTRFVPLIKRFGGCCASQGRFIRWQNYLNIPCPGTGRDGDPNISIELTPEIKAAVQELLDRLSPQEQP